MDDAALARLEHENMIATMSVAGGQVRDSVVRRIGGVQLIATGLPIHLFNQVLIADDDATTDALEAAIAVTRQRRDRFVVNLRVGVDDRFVPRLTELGLQALSPTPWLPGLALYPLGATPPAAFADGHEIRAVHDEAGLDDHIAAGAAGFDMPVAWWQAVMGSAMLERPDTTVYVGYTAGEPVSTGLGLVTGRTIGVYNVSTVGSARGRGYGSAMTARIVANGMAAGCDVAILQPSEMGRPIYERMGFREVVAYMGYVEPEVESAASGGDLG
jgi:GNAT superfamily N-acetyltransferase